MSRQKAKGRRHKRRTCYRLPSFSWKSVADSAIDRSTALVQRASTDGSVLAHSIGRALADQSQGTRVQIRRRHPATVSTSRTTRTAVCGHDSATLQGVVFNWGATRRGRRRDHSPRHGVKARDCPQRGQGVSPLAEVFESADVELDAVRPLLKEAREFVAMLTTSVRKLRRNKEDDER